MRVRIPSSIRAWAPAGALLVLLATGQPALAQVTGQTGVQAGQPYRGLFGAGTPAPRGGHALDATVSVYSEYGTERDAETPVATPLLEPGWFLGVRGGLAFESAGQYTRFGLRSDGAARYYRETGETTDPRYRVEMAIDSTRGRRHETILRFTGAFEHEPYYVLPLFPSSGLTTGGTAIVPAVRDDLYYPNARNVVSQGFNLDYQVSTRAVLSLFEDIRYTKAANSAYDARAVRAGARLGRRFTRYAAMRLGYAYQRGEYGADSAQRLEAHDIDVSIDYRRPLPRMRRTTFGFSTGSSRVSAGANSRWEIVGNVNLRREFDQGWFLQADYARNVRLVEGFAEPFFQNTVSGSLGGFMGRRVEVLTTGGYSTGAVGFGSSRYHALQGSARLRLALARYLAVDTEGLVNQHTFDAGVLVPGTVPADVNRWAVRCNVTIWLPLSR